MGARACRVCARMHCACNVRVDAHPRFDGLVLLLDFLECRAHDCHLMQLHFHCHHRRTVKHFQILLKVRHKAAWLKAERVGSKRKGQ